jgi:hypothetical protein
MELRQSSDFLRWAATHGIEPDKRYAEPRCLVYASGDDHKRFWEFPESPLAWPAFLKRLLSGLDAWSRCWAWPRGGRWNGAAGSDNPGDAIRGVVQRAMGIPDDWAGAAGFGAAELDQLVSVCFMKMGLGWHVGDDLFLLPDHGHQFLGVDHHRAIHVDFSSADRIEEFVSHMQQGGFSLPTEPPDETFKWPHWMGG